MEDVAALSIDASRFFNECSDAQFEACVEALSDGRFWAAVRVVREVLPHLALMEAESAASNLDAWRRKDR